MSHPRTAFVSELNVLSSTAAALGYAMPAEWAPMARVWLSPPHNDETWPGCLPEAQQQFAVFMRELAKHVEVATTESIGAATNDSWIRDFGPIYVKHRDSGKLAMHDFHFNGWGGKYETRDLDDVIPQHIARKQKRPLWIHDMVLEGGSIEVNGLGTVMTTEQCLLNDNRNPHLSREQLEQRLNDALGTTHVIWLPGGIIGDDTDGHIDDIARFVNEDTVVAVRPDADHPDGAMLDQNWQRLQSAKDQDGKPLNVLPLPAPQPILYDFPADRFGPGGTLPVPASYANFLIANRGVFVPVFNQPTDDVAMNTLAKLMPKHEIIPIVADRLVVGLGALHCLSQQEPAE